MSGAAPTCLPPQKNVVARAVATSSPNEAPSSSSSPSSSPRPAWVQELKARLPPRFVDAPSTYWRGGDTGHNQVHGADTVLATLHNAGAFSDPMLLVDADESNVLLMMRTGRDTAGGEGEGKQTRVRGEGGDEGGDEGERAASSARTHTSCFCF